jgi:hypothetical protein
MMTDDDDEGDIPANFYILSGLVTVIVSTEIEANSEEEALEIASRRPIRFAEGNEERDWFREENGIVRDIKFEQRSDGLPLSPNRRLIIIKDTDTP